MIDETDLMASSDVYLIVKRLAETGRLWIDIDGTWIEPQVSLYNEKILLEVGIEGLDESE